MGLKWKETTINLGVIPKKVEQNFVFVGESTYDSPIFLKSEGACGCTTTEDKIYPPGEVILGVKLSERNQTGSFAKKINITEPEEQTLYFKYVVK